MREEGAINFGITEILEYAFFYYNRKNKRGVLTFETPLFDGRFSIFFIRIGGFRSPHYFF